MKMFNRAKLSGFFGLSDEDYYEDEYEEMEETYNTRSSSTHANVRQESYQNYSQNQNSYERPKKVVSMPNSTRKAAPETTSTAAQNSVTNKVTVLEPRTYTEAKKIAQCIFRNEVVIVNFHLVEEAQARRIVDFLTGSVFALDGDIQRIGEEMFLCTPPNMEIDSTVAKSLLGSQFKDY